MFQFPSLQNGGELNQFQSGGQGTVTTFPRYLELAYTAFLYDFLKSSYIALPILNPQKWFLLFHVLGTEAFTFATPKPDHR